MASEANEVVFTPSDRIKQLNDIDKVKRERSGIDCEIEAKKTPRMLSSCYTQQALQSKP